MAQKVIDDQAIEIQHLRKQLFGRRSEKVSKVQLSLFVQTMSALVEREQQNQEPAPDEPRPKTKTSQKRRPLKPTRTEAIPVPASERSCPQCGGQRTTFDHARSIVVEYTPPKIEVIEYLREKVVCRPCEGEICIAPPPAERVVERALPGPNMLSALVVNKTVDGLPLHRSRRIFKRAGLDIPFAHSTVGKASPISSLNR
jgi:transposase